MRHLLLAACCIMMVFTVSYGGETPEDSVTFTRDQASTAQQIFGAEFTAQELDSLLPNLESNLDDYRKIRDLKLQNSVPPVLGFSPLPADFAPPTHTDMLRLSDPEHISRPEDLHDLAYYTVRDLGYLLREGEVTSVELTELFVRRLRRYDSALHCVITLTEELALEQARRADQEIAAGTYRGPLHGIPYGIKDLFATAEYKTTWGAMPYRDQHIDMDATVVKRLEKAGAVLVGKLTLGALAWGDVWYGGQTRNPWNPEQGSSGSSAGPAAATAAGLVPFAIGTETWGSIVSPATRCGVTGLRPTFGRVSRHGAMALSWSMDKIGPLARSVEDCAIIFDTIRGPDGHDPTVRDFPFRYTPEVDLGDVRIGYTKSLFDKEYETRTFDLRTLETLRSLGAECIPVELPDFPVGAMSQILNAEAAAAFQQLTISNRDSLLVRQIRNAWPNAFRAAWFIPAVEYIQANRARTVLIEQMADLMKAIDVYVVPSFGGDNLLRTNLTGHPCVVLPNGFRKDGTPVSISFIGDLYQEGVLLQVAGKYQHATAFHRKHTQGFK